MIKVQLMLRKHFMILLKIDRFYGHGFKRIKLMLIQGKFAYKLFLF